ncbi:MAG: sialate O-acetylesterase [Candidatus Latescibacteria bacterium]|nr:sialate O-acetylesterase [Candidatus Latescibacterota bacterium]
MKRTTSLFPVILLIVVFFTVIFYSDCTGNKQKDFHLYLLIGQSNMAGRGLVGDLDKQPHPRVFTLTKENTWIEAVDPIHFDKDIAGVGPGLTFGKTMADKNPNIRIGLIPCACGGSAISHWKTGVLFEQTKSYPYDDALKRAKIALKDGVLKGILWHQGEGDSNEESAGLYEQRLAEFITILRNDLGSQDVPFIAGELGQFFLKDRPEANIVNEALKRLPERVNNTAFVSSQGLTPKDDGVHFDTESARELGRRYAEAMMRLEKN